MNDSGMTGGSAGAIHPHSSGTGEEGVSGVSAASIESVKGGEMLMDALDLVHTELAAIAERATNTTTTTKHRCEPYSVLLILSHRIDCILCQIAHSLSTRLYL